MVAFNRNCWSAKARCRLAIAIADQQKPNAGLQSRLRVSKGQMLACNRDCGSARAKCWLTIAIADQQEPNAGLQSRLLISKSQMLACNRDCWSAKARCRLASGQSCQKIVRLASKAKSRVTYAGSDPKVESLH